MTIYGHQKANEQVLNYAHNRQSDIDDQIEQLTLERELMQRILDKFASLVCENCGGSGHVMRHIPGCECDGPRMHKCDVCSGTGDPFND